MLLDRSETFSRNTETPSIPLDRTQVPSKLGRRVLLFEFLVLLEYWLAPVFLGITNYAGLWSDVGDFLFVLFVGTLIVFVLIPLFPHLLSAFRIPRRAALFHSIWIVSLIAALFATYSFQVVDPNVGPAGPAVQFGETTVYSPFGAWPSPTVYAAPLHFFGTLDAQLLIVLALLSVLSASAVVLGMGRPGTACPTNEQTIQPRRPRWLALLLWSPLGFITGCASCAPVYFALVGVIAPSLVVGGYSAVPLVPWIGLAGLLYLVSFWLATLLISRATRPPTNSDRLDEVAG